jgi:UDP-3-O-[3-hydroxymyristoyl] glucosamine N-acyltransferase
MATNLTTLAELVGGRLVPPDSGSMIIEAAATLADAGEHDITLLDNPEKAHRLTNSRACAVVVPTDFTAGSLPAIQVADVHQAFAAVVAYFRPARLASRIGVSPLAVVSPSAVLEEDVDIHPGATIGPDVRIGAHSTIHSGVHVAAGCKLGSGVTIYPNAVLYENTVVGDRSIIHAGAVLGAFGFGYKMVGGRYQLSAQLGHVEIGCDVEIGAGTTIDRGTYSATSIGDGTKIDNQVMIAHNCSIGRHNMICSQVGIAGSTTTGDYVVMAGQVGVRDHVHIGARAVLGGQSGVVNDVPEGAQMLGAPAVPLREQKIQFAHLSRLPEMRQQIKQLQRQVEALSASNPMVSESLPPDAPQSAQPRGGEQAAA